MTPTAAEICIKEIVTTSINSTLETAVKKMTESNVRSIVILNENCADYYILTAEDAIEYKLQSISLQTKLIDIVLKRVKTIDAKVNIFELLSYTNETTDYLVVIQENRLIGILSQTDIINNIDPQILIEKQSIGNLILQYSAITVFINEATINAIKLMKYKHVDAVIVIDCDHKPAGIFTTKDFLNIIKQDADLNKPVKTYMSSPLLTVSEETKISEVLDFIKEKHFKRVVVTDQEGLISGLITQNEILRIINNKWIELIKERGHELSKMNEKLVQRATSLEEKASQDYLTKLYNRRKFNALITYEITQLKRYDNRNLCIIMLDLDGFKDINDTYGHDIGDEILIKTANIIQVSCRNSDIICRWGGEEFAIALSETAIDQAMIVAEKIRTSIEDHIFVNNLKITCSLGVSQYRTTDSYANLFKRADEALYKAKNSGKNRTEIEQI